MPHINFYSIEVTKLYEPSKKAMLVIWSIKIGICFKFLFSLQLLIIC